MLKALVVAGAPTSLGPGELAKRLGLTPAAMTHRIDRMVAEGLVTRERDETNRVRVIVELTDEGREKWLESMRMAAVFEEELLQDLTAGRARGPRRDPDPPAAPGGGHPAGRRRPARRPRLTRSAG